MFFLTAPKPAAARSGRSYTFAVMCVAIALPWLPGRVCCSDSPASTSTLASDPCSDTSLKAPDGADEATKSAYERLAKTCVALRIQGARNLVVSTKFAPLNAALKDFAVDNKTGRVTSPEFAAHSGRMLGLIVIANAGREIGRQLTTTIPSWCGKLSGRCTILALTPQDLESRLRIFGIVSAFNRLSAALASDSEVVNREISAAAGMKAPPGGGGGVAVSVAELILESGASAIAGAMKTDSTLTEVALDYSNDALLSGLGSIPPIRNYLILPDAASISASEADNNLIRDAYSVLNLELAKARAIAGTAPAGLPGLKLLNDQVMEVEKVLAAYTKIDGTNPAPIDSLILDADRLFPSALANDGLVLVIRPLEFGVHGGTNDSRWRTVKLIYVSDLLVQYALMTRSGNTLASAAVASTGHLACYPNERCGDQIEVSVKSLDKIQTMEDRHQ